MSKTIAKEQNSRLEEKGKCHDIKVIKTIGQYSLDGWRFMYYYQNMDNG